MRQESDSLGIVDVPQNKLWGAQTQRSLQNFPIGVEKIPTSVVRAYGLIKCAAAKVHEDLELMDSPLCHAIQTAAAEVFNGQLDDHFPLVIWQTGSGTQTNMNANEVIANRAIQLMDGDIGSKSPVHPNDHVNKSQSSNDSFPTAMHIATAEELTHRLLPSLREFSTVLHNKSKTWADIIKIGRTHLQDATPLTLGHEFSAFHAQIQYGIESIESVLPRILSVPQGGTAVGTGLNAPLGFADRFVSHLNDLTNLTFTAADNKFENIAAHDAMVDVSGRLNMIATSCMKIVNDIRLLGSGPRCGLGELRLPSNEPGSSIMPGKVNPTQCEAMAMICAQVMGNSAAVTIAGSHSHLQLNTFKPVMIYNVLSSIKLLTEGIDSFVARCLNGLQPDLANIQTHLDSSLMLVTALNQHIGYDKAAQIAKNAFERGLTLKESALASGFITEDDFDKWVQAKKMI